MKRILTLTLLLGFGLTAGAADMGMPLGNLMNDVGTMQNTNSQLQLMEQQRFRQEEYNEFQDMKKVKEARNKKLDLEQQMPQQRPATYNSDVEFVRENGRLILRSVK